jgi:predicted dehydrogenase
MTGRKIKVGIIGVDAKRGWASFAHIPALRQIPGFEITALSNLSKNEAMQAAAQFNIPYAFDNVDSLIESTEVDLVVVAVKVPYHKELVQKVLQAGKAVYCEWPLGNGLEEAVEMQLLASKYNVQAFVGLQSQCVPAINYIRDLVNDGYLGKVISSSIIASGLMLKTDKANAYSFDIKNGASILTIPFGATVHAMCHCLGQFRELIATTATMNGYGQILESGEMIPLTIEDQIVVGGRLENGAVVSIHYRGGDSKGTNFLWEINGTEGDLVITAEAGHVAFFPLTIKGAKRDEETLKYLDVPEKYFRISSATLVGPPYNVAQNYLNVLEDLTMGTTLAPRFEDAVIRHKLLAAVQESNRTGEKQYFI